MNTYEDDLLATRFAALAPRPLPGDWDDVLDRAGAAREGHRQLERPGAHSSRHRRLLIALAAVALVATATAAAWGIVREFILDKGFVGLPPVEATPSTPESGELVLSFNGRSATLPLKLHGKILTTPEGHRIGPMTQVFVYADGRVVWQREGGVPAGANKLTSGFLEQRLTPEGVELLRSKAISTGLLGHDLALVTGSNTAFWGTIQARIRERLVRVSWVQRDHLRDVLRDFPEMYAGYVTPATPEQERTLERLDALLTDPAASLPASAWQDRTLRAYVASRYAICWGHRPEQGLDDPSPAIEPSRVLALLPAAVEDLLRRRGFAPRGSIPPQACSVVPTEEARAVARALDDAGLEQGVVGNGIDASLGGLTYRFKAPNRRPGYVYVGFEPTLPHGEWVCTPCG